MEPEPRRTVALLIVIYLVLVIAVPLGLGLIVSYKSLPRSRACPLCQQDTIRLQALWLQRLSHALPGHELHRRWCLGCSWQGLARLTSAIGGTNGPRPAQRSQDPTAGEAVELKDLQVEGRPWRVVLEYWCDGGTWYGRLLFIGPTGRRWTDAASSLTGSTPREVLGQALALPERALIGRVRELISE